MYVKANRYNGCLQIETVAGFFDESLVTDECEFLRNCANLNEYDEVFGILSNEVYDILHEAYRVSY